MDSNSLNSNTPDQPVEHRCPACITYLAGLILEKAKADGLPLPTSTVTTEDGITFFIPVTHMPLWSEWIEQTPDRGGYIHTTLWGPNLTLSPTVADLLANAGGAR